MTSNFDFLAGKFPELADDGRKAEKYLYADNEVCMFFISRIFDNAVKYICGFNNVKTNGTNLAEPINEMFQSKAIDESIYLLLEMMRTFRNGNAHNKDYSLNESMILLQMSHVLCEWLMETYGNSGYLRRGFTMPQCEPQAQETPSEPTRAPETSRTPNPPRTPNPSRARKPKAPSMPDEEFITLCSSASAHKVRAAIAGGANVNAMNAKGRTALMMASLSNTHPEVIELLIDSGADVSVRSNRGTTALVYAGHNKRLQSTRALQRLQTLTKKS